MCVCVCVCSGRIISLHKKGNIHPFLNLIFLWERKNTCWGYFLLGTFRICFIIRVGIRSPVQDCKGNLCVCALYEIGFENQALVLRILYSMWAFSYTTERALKQWKKLLKLLFYLPYLYDVTIRSHVVGFWVNEFYICPVTIGSAYISY